VVVRDEEEEEAPRTPTITPKVQAQAVQALGRLGSAAGAAVPALLDILALPDSPLRTPAITALGRMGPAASAAVPTLVGMLTGQGEKYTLLTIEALGRIGPASSPAVPKLLELLTSAYGEMREAITTTLGQIGEGAAARCPCCRRRRRTRLAARHGPANPRSQWAVARDAIPDVTAAVRARTVRRLAAAQRWAAWIRSRTFGATSGVFAGPSPSVRRARRGCWRGQIGRQGGGGEVQEEPGEPYAVVRQDAAEILWHATGRAIQSVPAARERPRR
jgi:hypothetical protein